MKTSSSKTPLSSGFFDGPFGRLFSRWMIISFIVPLIGWSIVAAVKGRLTVAPDGSFRMLDCFTGPICLFVMEVSVIYYELIHGKRNDGVIPSDKNQTYFSGDAVITGIGFLSGFYGLVTGYVRGFHDGMEKLFTPLTYLVVGGIFLHFVLPSVLSLRDFMAKSESKTLRFLAGE